MKKTDTTDVARGWLLCACGSAFLANEYTLVGRQMDEDVECCLDLHNCPICESTRAVPLHERHTYLQAQFLACVLYAGLPAYRHVDIAT